jgi:hypothetical protein
MPPSNAMPVAAWRDSGKPDAVLAAFRLDALGNQCGTTPERSRDHRQTQPF